MKAQGHCTSRIKMISNSKLYFIKHLEDKSRHTNISVLNPALNCVWLKFKRNYIEIKIKQNYPNKLGKFCK